MPCYDSRNDPEYVAKEATKAARKEAQKEINRLSQRCHELTALLCEAGRARADRRKPSLAVRKWWRKHAAIDAANGKPWDNPPR